MQIIFYVTPEKGATFKDGLIGRQN